MDCVERQGECTAACELGAARNYTAVAPASELGQPCTGPTDCLSGEGACATTTPPTGVGRVAAGVLGAVVLVAAVALLFRRRRANNQHGAPLPAVGLMVQNAAFEPPNQAAPHHVNLHSHAQTGNVVVTTATNQVGFLVPMEVQAPGGGYLQAAAGAQEADQFPDPTPTPPTKLSDSSTVDDSEIYDAVYTENPLEDMYDLPYCTLEQAVALAQVHSGEDLQAAVRASKAFAAKLARTNKLGPLTEAEAAVVNLYTQQTPKLYFYVNGALGGYGKGGRSALHHYLPYIKLLRAALRKLPPQYTTIVYRGSKCPLHKLIPYASVGLHVVWWAFTSTSRSKDARKEFGGGSGTIFQISSNDGRDISQYSSFGDEKEVVLLPGSQFVIDYICPYGGSEEVRMHQLPPEDGGGDADADAEGSIYGEPADPPVYDEADCLVLQSSAAGGGSSSGGGAAPPVDYAVYAGSTDGVYGAQSAATDAVYASADGTDQSLA